MGNTLNLQTNEPSDLGEEPEWVHNDDSYINPYLCIEQIIRGDSIEMNLRKNDIYKNHWDELRDLAKDFKPTKGNILYFCQLCMVKVNLVDQLEIKKMNVKTKKHFKVIGNTVECESPLEILPGECYTDVYIYIDGEKSLASVQRCVEETSVLYVTRLNLLGQVLSYLLKRSITFEVVSGNLDDSKQSDYWSSRMEHDPSYYEFYRYIINKKLKDSNLLPKKSNSRTSYVFFVDLLMEGEARGLIKISTDEKVDEERLKEIYNDVIGTINNINHRTGKEYNISVSIYIGGDDMIQWKG